MPALSWHMYTCIYVCMSVLPLWRSSEVNTCYLLLPDTWTQHRLTEPSIQVTPTEGFVTVKNEASLEVIRSKYLLLVVT